MKRWLLLTGMLVVLLAAGASGLRWYQPGKSVTSHGVLVQNQPYEISVTPSERTIAANDRVRLNVKVTRGGKIADIYQEGRVVHYVIASANYHDFYHTFAPEVVGPGTFYLDHTFTQAGTYRIWTELTDTHQAPELQHGAHADVISYTEVTVQGEEKPRNTAQFVQANRAPIGSYQLVVDNVRPRAGQAHRFRLRVENAAGDVLPVFPAEPAIYVMVGPDFDFFRHTHTTPAVEGKFIAITETFPTPGEYLWWVEVYAKNGATYDNISAPFLLTVTPR